MSITKKQFIEKMACKGGMKKVEAKKQVNLFLDTLTEYLKEEGIVKFSEFGKFEVKTVKEIVGRNPKNGNVCIVPEHKKVKFYGSKILADKMD